MGDQTGLSPIASLISIYIGWRLAGVLGMILGPTIALIALNLIRLGIFEGVRLDLAAAAGETLWPSSGSARTARRSRGGGLQGCPCRRTEAPWAGEGTRPYGINKPSS